MEKLRVLMMVLGLLAVGLGLRAKYRNRHAENWPSVRGTVIRSELHSSADNQTRLNIAFRYDVAGRVVESHPIVLAFADLGPATIQKVLKRLTTGRRVTVYYDPAHPETATVDTAPSGNWLEAVVAGLALLIFAAVGF